MASNLMRLSRKALSPQGWQRIKGHLQKGIYFSLNYMLWSILYEVFWKINPYSCVSRFLCRRKEHYIERYLKKNYKFILEKYQSVHSFLGKRQQAEIPIYFFWYQGWTLTPPIIRNNYKILRRYCGDRARFISKENIEEYIHLSDIIYEKVECGMISYTHFADIVRMTLIAERGGIWVDATTLVCKDIPKQEEMFPIITRKSQPLMKSGVFHKNRYACWCIGSPYPKYPLFCFVSEILLEYCKKEKQWIDYLFMDYLLAWGIDNIPIVAKDFSEIPSTNESAFMLIDKMGRAFDKKEFEEYCKSTWFFKMSIKRIYSDYTLAGEATYYKKWKDNTLFE